MQQFSMSRRQKNLQRATSQRKIDLKTENKIGKSPRNVKFIEKIVETQQSRKKHHSASILKKRSQSPLQKTKQRSDSVNSMASQGPLDDQSCQNSNLNKNVKDQYNHLLQISSKKGKFTDSFFPPVISSLFSFAGRKKNKYPNIKWMRLSQIFQGKNVVIFNPNGSKVKIQPATNLSSQYFSLALNIIRGNKNLLYKMFEDQKFNEQGIYYVKIFQAKVWKYLIIDDFIPVLASQNQRLDAQPLFTKLQQSQKGSTEIQIWPFILEKALAKFYSSYQALQSGNIFDCLEELTNKTCQQFDLTKNKDYLKLIVTHPDCIFFGQNKEQKKTPIYTYPETSNRFHFMIAEKQVSIEGEDLSKYFNKLYALGQKLYSYVGQCPIRQSAESISVRQFYLKSTTYCSLSINQKDKRFFQDPIKYQYSWMRMILIQKQFNGGYRWIDGRYDNQKSLNIQGQFQPGDYYVLIMPEWIQRSFELTLIIRSKIPVRLERKVYQQGMIEQACADLAQRYGRLNQLNTYICSYNCIHEDMGFIIENINNERMKGQIKIVRSIDGLKSRVQIEAVNKQFRHNKSIQVIIKHNSHFTVVLKMKGGLDKQFFQNFDFGGK